MITLATINVANVVNISQDREFDAPENKTISDFAEEMIKFKLCYDYRIGVFTTLLPECVINNGYHRTFLQAFWPDLFSPVDYFVKEFEPLMIMEIQLHKETLGKKSNFFDDFDMLYPNYLFQWFQTRIIRETIWII